MEKQVIRNWHLQGMIRAFAGAVIGSGFDFAISEALQKLRPKEVEFVPISMSEAASLAAVVIAQVENCEGR
ncbi:MAG: hypothetical protein J5858_14430 [Lentisphaeria bacterium]|nr:hypothetical protein [Lentisphaeria bacterium]